MHSFLKYVKFKVRFGTMREKDPNKIATAKGARTPRSHILVLDGMVSASFSVMFRNKSSSSSLTGVSPVTFSRCYFKIAVCCSVDSLVCSRYVTTLQIVLSYSQAICLTDKRDAPSYMSGLFDLH